jgi:hypothetical protein
MSRTIDEPLSPLESFLRDYVEARDGIWDEIEPKVYDALIGPDIIQVAFDPEALPEHPRAQLASLGSPLFDRLLSDAADRWSSARFYRVGLNLQPQHLASQLRRAITLPANWAAEIERVRAMNCPQAIFWFTATFSSDQKEQEMLRVGLDLHYAREVRQLDALLAFNRLSEAPEVPLPETPHVSLASGYEIARRHAARSVASLANARRRDWSGTIQKQIARMSGYYAQLRQEAVEQTARSTDAAVAEARKQSRREAIDREERLRIAELRRKSALCVQVKLSRLMIVQQPKLVISLKLASPGRLPAPAKLEATWDPISNSMEAIPCLKCGQPTFEFETDRAGLKCTRCPVR